jgi:predicted Ser/Thr protein kinase
MIRVTHDASRKMTYRFDTTTKIVTAVNNDNGEETEEKDNPSLRERLAMQGICVKALFAKPPKKRFARAYC